MDTPGGGGKTGSARSRASGQSQCNANTAADFGTDEKAAVFGLIGQSARRYLGDNSAVVLKVALLKR